MSTLSERIKKAAEAAGETQTSIAFACSIKKPSVNNWFSGETKKLKYETAKKAAKFLKVRVDWLAEGVGPMIEDGEASTYGASATPGMPGTPETTQPPYDPIIDDLARLPERVASAWRKRIASEADFYESTNSHGPKTPDDRRLDPDRRQSNGGPQR